MHLVRGRNLRPIKNLNEIEHSEVFMNKPLAKWEVSMSGIKNFAPPVKSGRSGPIYRSLFTGLMALLLISAMASWPLPAAADTSTLSASIAADVASGKDIAQIIQSALDGGMPLDKVIEAIIQAGANPGNSTYLAITTPHPAVPVIKGACAAVSAMGLTEPNLSAGYVQVFKAAIDAGATQTQITMACGSAGVDATLISNVYAQASSGAGPVFGYSAPGGGPTGSSGLGFGAPGGGAGGGAGGGGGGGITRTRNASPSRP